MRTALDKESSQLLWLTHKIHDSIFVTVGHKSDKTPPYTTAASARIQLLFVIRFSLVRLTVSSLFTQKEQTCSFLLKLLPFPESRRFLFTVPLRTLDCTSVPETLVRGVFSSIAILKIPFRSRSFTFDSFWKKGRTQKQSSFQLNWKPSSPLLERIRASKTGTYWNMSQEKQSKWCFSFFVGKWVFDEKNAALYPGISLSLNFHENESCSLLAGPSLSFLFCFWQHLKLRWNTFFLLVCWTVHHKKCLKHVHTFPKNLMVFCQMIWCTDRSTKLTLKKPNGETSDIFKKKKKTVKKKQQKKPTRGCQLHKLDELLGRSLEVSAFPKFNSGIYKLSSVSRQELLSNWWTKHRQMLQQRILFAHLQRAIKDAFCASDFTRDGDFMMRITCPHSLFSLHEDICSYTHSAERKKRLASLLILAISFFFFFVNIMHFEW